LVFKNWKKKIHLKQCWSLWHTSCGCHDLFLYQVHTLYMQRKLIKCAVQPSLCSYLLLDIFQEI